MSAAQPASAPVASAAATTGTYRAEGKVESIEPESITITHGPVPALKWPSMTMGFGKPSPTAFPDLKPGDTVRFAFRKGGPMDYELVSVQKSGGTQ